MINFSVDQTGIPVSSRLSPERLQTLEHVVNKHLPTDVSGQVNVGFVTDEEIRRLNRMYRNKDTVTDVLSFSYLEDAGMHASALGDVVISYEQAVRQAEAGDVELEVVDLLVHGILHVFGYDHETPEDAERMFPLQDRIVNEIL